MTKKWYDFYFTLLIYIKFIFKLIEVFSFYMWMYFINWTKQIIYQII